MTPEQYKAAEALAEERSDIRDAIKIWTDEVTSLARLAYRQSWNKDHCTELPTPGCSKIAFDAFREASIASMTARLAAIEVAFSNL